MEHIQFLIRLWS